MKTKVPGYTSQQTATDHVQGSILPRSRYRMVVEAMQRKCTHLLFVDTDQTFPRNTLHRMLAHKVGVVAANIATKSIPAQPTARAAPKGQDKGFGTPVFTDPESKGLERVWRVGTGLMLVDMEVFKRTGPKIFSIDWHDDVADYGGEDWSMVKAFESVNEPIWIDHDLSREVGHIGYMVYTHELVGEVSSDDSSNFLQKQKVVG
jgi:hypothetical protein